MMENTTMNMTENTTLNMKPSPQQVLCVDYLCENLSFQMLFFGLFYLYCTVLPAMSAKHKSEPLTLKTNLVLFITMCPKAFTIFYYGDFCKLILNLSAVRATIWYDIVMVAWLHSPFWLVFSEYIANVPEYSDPIIHELCSCLTLLLPLVYFTHIWNPTLMNPIASLGDRVTLFCGVVGLIMAADHRMVFEIKSSIGYTVYNIPYPIYTAVSILALAYLVIWTRILFTSHEFEETASSRKYYSIFDWCSTLTIIGLSMAIGIVFTLAYLFGTQNVNLLFCLYETLKLLFLLVVLFKVCPRIEAAIKDAGKLPTTTVSTSDQVEVLKVLKI